MIGKINMKYRRRMTLQYNNYFTIIGYHKIINSKYTKTKPFIITNYQLFSSIYNCMDHKLET